MNNTINETTTTILQNVLYFNFVDYTVFGILLSFSAAIGLYFGCCGKDHSTEEYLSGGHKMKTIPIAISLVASQLSAISIMTIPAEIYSFGWQYSFIVPNLVLITIACNYIYIPVFYHNNIDNCYVYLEMRFNKTVRNIITVSFVIVCFFILPVIMFIPSLAFAQVTGHNIHVINAVVCYVCIFYTMLGGIKAVVWTDVLQAAIMVISIILVAIFGIIKVGGFGEIWDRGVAGGRIHSPDFTLDLTTRQTFWNFILGMYIIWGCHVGLNQSCVQRIVALPTLRQSRRALVYFCAGVMFIMGVNCFTGVLMYAYYYNCDPVKAKIVSKYDKMIPYFVQDVVGHINGMPGVFISCVFSASLSTVSASLHSLSGVVYNDYIRPLKIIKHSDTNANLTMRIIIFIVGTFCILAGIVVEKFSSIFQVVNTIAGTFTGAVFGVFTIGMLYPWANTTGALYGIVASMCGMFWLNTISQINIAKGNLKYDVLPTSIEGCNSTINGTQLLLNTLINTTASVTPKDDDFEIYKISFLWYSVIGVIIMWAVCIPVSYFTGGQDLKSFNVNLLAPIAQNLVPKKYRHIELQTVNKNENEQEKTKLDATEWVWKNTDTTGNQEKEQIK